MNYKNIPSFAVSIVLLTLSTFSLIAMEDFPSTSDNLLNSIIIKPSATLKFLAAYEEFNQAYPSCFCNFGTASEPILQDAELRMLSCLQNLHKQKEKITALNGDNIDPDNVILQFYNNLQKDFSGITGHYNSQKFAKYYQIITNMRNTLFEKQVTPCALTFFEESDNENMKQQSALIQQICENINQFSQMDNNDTKQERCSTVRQQVANLIGTIQTSTNNTNIRIGILNSITLEPGSTKKAIQDMLAKMSVVAYITHKKQEDPNNLEASIVALDQQIAAKTIWPNNPLQQIKYIHALDINDYIKIYLFQLMWWTHNKNTTARTALYSELWNIRNKGKITIQQLLPQIATSKQTKKSYPIFYNDKQCHDYRKQLQAKKQSLNSTPQEHTAYQDFLNTVTQWEKTAGKIHTTLKKTKKLPPQQKAEKEEEFTLAKLLESNKQDNKDTVTPSIAPDQSNRTAEPMAITPTAEITSAVSALDWALIRTSPLTADQYNDYANSLHTLAMHVKNKNNDVANNIKEILAHEKHAHLIKQTTTSFFDADNLKKLEEARNILQTYYPEFTVITQEIFNNRKNLKNKLSEQKPFYLFALYKSLSQGIEALYPRPKGDEMEKKELLNKNQILLERIALAYYNAYRDITHEPIVIEYGNKKTTDLQLLLSFATDKTKLYSHAHNQYITVLKEKALQAAQTKGFFSTLWSYAYNRKLIRSFDNACTNHLVSNDAQDTCFKEIKTNIDTYRNKTWWNTIKETLSWWRSFLPF